ncbi:hypothetical protein V2A89_02210 [Pseudomonas aeruginosa]
MKTGNGYDFPSVKVLTVSETATVAVWQFKIERENTELFGIFLAGMPWMLSLHGIWTPNRSALRP